MTVRKKISLLITAAGFLSSLLFSCFILLEMLEQPFRMIDSELGTEARWAVRIISSQQGTRMNEGVTPPDNALLVGNDRYWLKIYDPNTGRPLYRSQLAQRINIPEPAPDSVATVRVIVPPKQNRPGHDSREKVAFRVRCLSYTLGGKTFLVCAGRPMEELEEEVWEIVAGIVVGLTFSALLLLAISYFVAGLILKPVRVMNDQAREITERRLHRRIPVSGDHDEFSGLAQTLNQVFDRLQYAFMRQERLLADVSHELKTPLTMMRLALDETRTDNDETPNRLRAEDLARLTEQVLRMERLVKNLLGLSSLEIEGSTTKDRVDLAGMLDALISDYRFLADTRDIQVSDRLPEQLVVVGDAEKLHRAFSNILDNAIKYNTNGGRVEVFGSSSAAELTITVTNTGPGVAQAEIPKVFDPFYRVEKSRSTQHGGSGLGLAIVKRIIELHGGKVMFESEEGAWTRVVVSLPHPSRDYGFPRASSA